jgi:uncharacterized protein YqeY
MTLQEQIRQDMKDAMRAGDAMKRDVLRMLESAVKNAAIEKKLDRETIDDALVQEVIRRSVKQRKDSIEQYEQGGRPELAEKEKEEVEVLRQYLPQAIGEDEVRNIVQDVVRETGAASPSDFGKVMGKAMQAVGGRAEGDVVKRIVEEALGK